jgi:hypothetical protein
MRTSFPLDSCPRLLGLVSFGLVSFGLCVGSTIAEPLERVQPTRKDHAAVPREQSQTSCFPDDPPRQEADHVPSRNPFPSVRTSPSRRHAARFRVAQLTLVSATDLAAPAAEPAGKKQAAEPARRLADLADTECTESSGLARSRLRQNVFWTHNDSGDRGRLFCFDRQGRNLGQYEIPTIQPIDCEDMASFLWKGSSTLLLADIGDNARRRSELSLYWFAEPRAEVRICEPITTIRFRYEDGSHDCESIAVDPASRQILLVTKSKLAPCSVYQLTIPADFPEKPLSTVQVARKLASLPVAVATGMDLSTDGRRLVICTYQNAFIYERQAEESWPQAMTRAPHEVLLPVRQQGEAICWDADEQTLLLTSEKIPTPFWLVRP